MRKSIAVLLLLPAFAIAQTELPDIDSMSIEEINKLPPEVQNELPYLPTMRKIFSKSDLGISEEMLALFLSVNVSGYLLDLQYTPYLEDKDQIKRAVSAFQRDIGAKTTGELTMGQAEELQRRATRRHDTPVTAGINASVHRIDDWVTATGTWIIENGHIAFPINTVKIDCYKNQGTCQLFHAYVVIPSLESSRDEYDLYLDTATYEIISWTDNEVISRPFKTTGCISILLTINSASEEVYEIQRNNNQEGCKFGSVELPPLEQPQISRLVEGYNTNHAFWQERQEATEEFMNSERLERFQKFYGMEK